MKKMTRIAGSVLAAVALAPMAACAKPHDGATQEIRIFTYSGDEYAGAKMDSVFQKIESDVGVTIAFEGAKSENYYTKLTPMMNSMDFPDVIWSDPENSEGAFQRWADPSQDLLWNLDELLIGNENRYPYLNKLVYSNQYKNIQYFEGHYLIPAVETKTAWAIYYRADWLKAIGFVDSDGNAKAPETLDEFEYVMSKFSGNNLFADANGNHSGQTYGISPNTYNYYLNPLYGAFGITPDWDITDSGAASYMYARDEFKPYLEWMNAMYKKGWIDPTFNQNTGDTDRNQWYNGKVGCIMTNGEGHMEWVVANFEDANGADKVIVGPPLLGTGNTSELTGKTLGVKGERGYSDWGGDYGGYAITKGTKDVYKTLDLLEYLISPEGSKLRLYGIEGTHYTLDEDGNVVADLDGRNSERSNYFAKVKDLDGNPVNAGLHGMGSRFGYAVDWDEYERSGNIEIATDIGSLYPRYGALVRQAVEYTKYLQHSKLVNVTAYPSLVYNKMAEVKNISWSFVNKAIIGTANLSGDWDRMISDLKKAGYTDIQNILKETAQELGIIA